MNCELGSILILKKRLERLLFRTNKILPICQNDIKYYELLKTVNSGNLLSQDELIYVYSLPRENLLVIIKLYNINSYNNIINNPDILLQF